MISTFAHPEDHEAPRVWAGRGTGNICTGCGKPIQASEVEYEVEMPARDSVMRFHVSCYEAYSGG